MNNISLLALLIVLTACQSKDYLGDEKVAASTGTTAATTQVWDKSGSDISYTTGLVGIGTAPLDLLHVSGPSTDWGTFRATNTQAAADGWNWAGIFEFSNTVAPTNGGGGGIILYNADTSANSMNVISFQGTDSTGNGRHSGVIVAGKESNWIGGSGSYPGYMSFWTRPANNGDEFERMRITSTGDVGIGATTPNAKFAVSGTDLTTNGGFWSTRNLASIDYVVDPGVPDVETHVALASSLVIPLASTTSKQYLYSSLNLMQNDGSGNISNIWGGANSTSNAGTGTIGSVVGSASWADSSAGTVSAVLGSEVWTAVSGGTVTEQVGVVIDMVHSGGTLTSRYGVKISAPTGAGTPTNDYGIYQISPAQDNFFGGQVGIGTNNPSEMLHVVGNILASGTITPSDLRLKKNVLKLENNVEKLAQVRPVSYDWKDSKHGTRKQLGVIAQELEKVYPEAITKTKDGFLAVSYDFLISPLIGAVQELKGMIQKNDKDIAELKGSLVRAPAGLDEVKNLRKENAMLKEDLSIMRGELCKKDSSYSFCKNAKR